MDPTRNLGYYGDADLGDYLSRPVQIREYQWTVATGELFEKFDPWTLFLENVEVKKRIEGFRLLQGKLHLRFAINGGPFFYGRMMASYEPRPNDNDRAFGTNGTRFLTQQLSQFPHLFLDPTASEGGELICPFFCPDNWLDLVGQSYKDMGAIWLTTINNLYHANSSTGQINVTVYAWMDDVKLAAPTTAPFGAYEAHSGVEFEPHAGDEYGTGIVSKPASAISRAAGALGTIPSIAPFMRATEMISSAIGRVAHHFGYSRPSLADNLGRCKIKGIGNLSNVDQHEALIKLSMDSKQELTVDPRTTGLSDVDEMSFHYIKQKEAYMGTFEWSEDSMAGLPLTGFVVGPDYHNETEIFGQTVNALAPLYTVAAPFKYWRGSIKIRFQIVASQLHRGRLRIMYDPIDTGLSFPAPGENKIYSKIVDLATNRDFELVVSWNHPQGWLRVKDRLGSGQLTHVPGSGVLHETEYHNGYIRVDVVNQLTSPDPALGQPVFVNYFVSAGDDFEVASPSDDLLEYCEFERQDGFEIEQVFEAHSGTEETEEVIAESDNIPESPTAIDSIGYEASLSDKNTHVYFGEAFSSVRALLKRYCYHNAYLATAENTHMYVVESNFPCAPGRVSSLTARHRTAAADPNLPDTPYNFTGMTYLNWFTPCYVGWRGGLRSKYHSPKQSGYSYVRRLSEPVAQATCGSFDYTIDVESTSATAVEHWGLMKGGNGHDYVSNVTDGALEVEFPFYSNKRFAPAKKFLNGLSDEWKGENFGHFASFCVDTFGGVNFVTRHVAAGDDYSLFFWTGQPPIYRAETKPLAEGQTQILPSTNARHPGNGVCTEHRKSS